MTKTSRILRITALSLMAAFTLLGGLFVVGATFEDPGGWHAVGLTSAWLVPLMMLTIAAYVWPDTARWVLLGGTGAVGVAYLLGAIDPGALRDFLNDVGPVLGIGAFLLGLPLATLGLHRPGWAGSLLAATSLLAFAGFLLQVRGEVFLGFGAALSTSGTVICLPFLFVAGLLLLAAMMGRGAGQRPGEPAEPQPPVGAAA